jgi:DNA-binding FrmR family transcriptional regulator
MKDVYKQKIVDLLNSIQGRVVLIDKMIDGQKQANPQEAKQYIKEINKGLEQIEEFISIS